jgi:hypothetical protein
MRRTIVGGRIQEYTGEDYVMHANEGISYSGTTISETGVDNGVSNNKPDEAPKKKEEKPKKFLHLLFYVSEEHKGKFMISESAQTRLQNIKKQSWFDDNIYKAFCIPIQSIDEIITQVSAIIKKHGGKEIAIVQEIGVFSHAGGDGPISYNKKITTCPVDEKWPHQMAMCGWEKIEVTWSKAPKMVFYGCNTANINWNNFSLNISNLANFKDVEVWGQSSSSFPSFYPDKRHTSGARSTGDNGMGWDVAETYQVAGNASEGWKALLYPIPVNPLNVYKNGTLIKSTHQGIFNDHR